MYIQSTKGVPEQLSPSNKHIFTIGCWGLHVLLPQHYKDSPLNISSVWKQSYVPKEPYEQFYGQTHFSFSITLWVVKGLTPLIAIIFSKELLVEQEVHFSYVSEPKQSKHVKWHALKPISIFIIILLFINFKTIMNKVIKLTY